MGRLEVWTHETKGEQECEMKAAVDITQRCLKVVYACYQNDLAGAKNTVEALDHFVNNILPTTPAMRDLTEQKRIPYSYILLAVQAHFEFELKNYDAVRVLLKDLGDILLEPPEVKSMFKVLKSSFLAHLGLKDERLRLLREVRLNPVCRAVSRRIIV